MLNPILRYALGASLFLTLILGIGLALERRHANKLEARNAELAQKLDDISTKRNEQKAETKERVRTVVKTIHDADGRAKVVEAAPLPGNCQTPQVVIQADI